MHVTNNNSILSMLLTEYFGIGEKTQLRRGLLGLCQNHPTEMEVTFESVIILIVVVVLAVKLYELMKKRCCCKKAPAVSSTNAVVEEESLLQVYWPPPCRRVPFQQETQPEVPRYTLNFTIPNVNPFNLMRNMQPYQGETQARPALENRRYAESRFEDVSNGYGARASRRERVARSDSTYEPVGRRASALASALPRPPIEAPKNVK